MDIVSIFQQTIFGLVLGLNLAILSYGFSLTYGLSRIVNFAHGFFYVIGAYITYLFVSVYSNLFIGILLGALVTGCTALIIERVLIRRLYKESLGIGIIVTYAAALVGTSIIKYFFGLIPKALNVPKELSGPIYIGSIYISKYYLFLIICSLIVFGVCQIMLNKTMLGKIIRAGIANRERVLTLGINIDKILAINFFISGVLSGLSGGLISPIRYLDPGVGSTITTSCFAVVVVGGLGSFFGSLCGGIFLGLVISYASVFNPIMAEGISYLIMAIFLIVRPQGFFGSST